MWLVMSLLGDSLAGVQDKRKGGYLRFECFFASKPNFFYCFQSEHCLLLRLGDPESDRGITPTWLRASGHKARKLCAGTARRRADQQQHLSGGLRHIEIHFRSKWIDPDASRKGSEKNDYISDEGVNLFV